MPHKGKREAVCRGYSLFGTMEYTTVAIRWCYESTHHINAQPPPELEITDWCLSRWEGQSCQPTKQYLTMVCMKNKAMSTADVETMVLRKAANLWIPASMNKMTPGQFDVIVSMHEDTSLDLDNMYTTVTSTCWGCSFYEYVTRMADLARTLGWSETKNGLCGDDVTIYKLHCKHVSSPGGGGGGLPYIFASTHSVPCCTYSYLTSYYCVAGTSQCVGDPRNATWTEESTADKVHGASTYLRPSE